jgi:hypothetical protein
MTAKELKQKYPEVWDQIENAVKEDLKVTEGRMNIIANNAAFEACFYFDKYITNLSRPKPVDTEMDFLNSHQIG